MSHFVLLLRGINVGGNNSIPMQELRDCLESIGLASVKTYIQSGNVIFSSSSKSEKNLTTKISAALKKKFGYSNPVLVLSESSFEKIVESKPTWFGKNSEKYKYDVIFLLPEIKSSEIFSEIELREGVDRAEAGHNAIFFSRDAAQLSKSKLSKIVQKNIYKQTTIRNWRTTQKLQSMLKEV